MKRQEAMSVGEIIERAINATGHRDEYDRQQICYAWADVVGPGINRCTVRRWMDRDILHVVITSAAVKNELMYQTDRLIPALNARTGRNTVSKIIIH